MKLTATPREETASVIIEGTGVPQCHATVYRYSTDGTTSVLRGALNMAIVTGQLYAEDTEAPFNEELRYVVLFEIAQGASRIIQQNLIVNPSFETNLTSWTAGTGRTLSRAHLLNPGAQTGDALPFDIREIIPTRPPNLYPFYANSPIMDAVRDPLTNEWYVSQNTQGTLAAATSTVISRLTPDGLLLSTMTLTNAGLGAHIDLQRIGNDVWIWTSYRTVGTGGVTTANDLARVRYSPGVKTKASLTAADYLAINDFTTNYTTAKLDVDNDFAIVRIESGTAPTRTETYYRRKISEMLAGTNTIYGQVGPFSIDLANPNHLGKTLQGFAFYGDQLYRYTGEQYVYSSTASASANNPLTKPSQVALYTVTTGLIATEATAFEYSLDTTTLGFQTNGTPAGGYREPAGLSIYRQSSGEIVMATGVTVGASTARQHQVHLFTQQPVITNPDEGDAAWVGSDVAVASFRANQVGDSTEDPPIAPLARVNANFPTSTEDKDYAFSFHSRLNDDSLAYYFGSEIVIGSVPQTWGDGYAMYPSWGLPLSQDLTWGDGQYARISGVGDEWLNIVQDPLDGGYDTDTGEWDAITGTFTLPQDRAELRARNYVGNPTFAISTAGYVPSAASGPVPLLSVVPFETENVLQIHTSVSTVGPRVTFTANGLTPGTEYKVAVTTKVPINQSLQLQALDGGVTSFGVVGDEFNDWIIDTVNFTAAAATEQLVIVLGDNLDSNTIIDHVAVTLPDVDYFDGGMPDDQDYFYTWVGASNASMSERLPHSMLLAPTTDPHTEYSVSWHVAPIGLNPIEVTIGIVDEDGVDLVPIVHQTIPGGSTVIESGFGDGFFGTGSFGSGIGGYGMGGYGDGPYGIGSGTALGPATTLTLATVDTREWAPGWRPYVMISDPGARVIFDSSYHTYTRPTFVPYSIGVRAQVIAPNGSVVVASDVLNYATVVQWVDTFWEFTLPPTVVGQYRIEIVPEVTWEASRTSWQLDGVMLETKPLQAGRLDYLDGAQPIPDVNVPGWLAPEDVSPYDSTSGDTLIHWLGTAHASVSEFVGASEVTAVLITTLLPPSGVDTDLVPGCEPINLTDPTQPSLNGWFTLQLINELSYEARSESFAVINRQTPIVISQVRSSASSSMSLLLSTFVERQRLLDLLTPGRVLLLRNPDPSYPENGWYLAVGTVSEARIAPDHRLAYRRFSFDFQVVDRPGGIIAAPPRITWEAVNATYTSWGPRVAPAGVLINADTWNDLVSKTPAIETPFAIMGSYA